jgi:vacuolar-type H+-ATPase subunit I/STV1
VRDNPNLEVTMASKSGNTTSGPGKAAKKLAAATAMVEELTAEVTALRTRVKALEAESGEWKKQAEKQKSRVHKVRAKAEKAIAEANAKRKKAKARARQVIADHPRAEPLALMEAPKLPQPTWTVAQLREAAKDQGVAGYSRMRKDQLLAQLI